MSEETVSLATARTQPQRRGRLGRLLVPALLLASLLLGVAAGRQYERRRLQPKLNRYWQNAREEVDKQPGVLAAQDLAEREKGIRYRKLFRGDPSLRQVALTFDDGPHPAYTPRLLEILERYHAPATFFLVGEMAARYPDLVRAELAAGHDLGNHTFHHVNLTRIPDEDIAAEIRACGDVLTSITGSRPHLFRPPGGDYDRRVAEVAETLGYTMVLWTDDPGDYASPGDRLIEQRVLQRIGNGGIVLIHDGVEETIEILPQILQALHDRGYGFVTIDEMLRRAGAAQAAGRPTREGQRSKRPSTSK